MKMFKYLIFLVLYICSTGFAESTSKIFSLESPLSGAVHGPFIFQNNFVAKIDSDKYLIQVTPNGFLQLKDMVSNKISEPYEFTQGRMIRIDETLFTIIDVKEIPYVPPLPAPKQRITPKPKPIIKPLVTTSSIATTTVATKRIKTIKPKSKYKPTSAMWTTTPKKRVETTSKSIRKISKKRRAKPAPKPKDEVTSYFTPQKYQPQKKKNRPKYAYKAKPKTVPYHPRSPAKLSPYKEIAFVDRLGISVDISAMEKVNYDYKLSNSDVSTDAEISRNSISARFKVMPFTLELGKVFNADWSGQIAGANLPFTNLDLSNGSGWWWDLKYSYPLWKNNGWLLSATADGSYRKEDYDLSYGIWKDTSVLIEPEGTNGVATVETIKKLSSTTQPAIFTEKMFKLGLLMSYKEEFWGCWAAADLIAYHTADIESTIDTAAGSYTIDVERTDPFIFTVGVSMKKSGINWFSAISLAGERAIRFGANYRF